MTSSIKPEVHNITAPPEEDRATAMGNMHKKIGEDRTCSSEDMIADRHTRIHTQTDTHAHYHNSLDGKLQWTLRPLAVIAQRIRHLAAVRKRYS